MRNALASAVFLFLLCSLRGDAQTLSSYDDSAYHTSNGYQLGMPQLTPPVLKAAPTPYVVPRSPGRLPNTIDVLVKIDKQGSVKPIRVERVEGVRSKDAEDRAMAIVRGWSFEPGRLKNKPVDVALTLSVPLETDHPSPGSGRPFLPDFAPAALSPGDPRAIPAFVRMRAVSKYASPKAMQARISGEVEIAFVVEADGRVGETRVTKSLDAAFGLDALALTSLKSWFFEPALVDGRPVPMKMVAEMSFILR